VLTGEFYVGSSVNLASSYYSYFRFKTLEALLSKQNTIISPALLKYGYGAFSLEILEYCDKSVVLEREQHYLDTLSPSYNVI
jgi:group I intron endonuclease